MNLFYYFVMLTISLVFIIVVIMSYNYKSRLKDMSGMIISMAVGTGIGLTAGVLLGSIYQGSLYVSTLYSVLIGILAGFTCGLIFGILPALEGFMGGLMGGMMGAMLGEMITNDQSNTMVSLFLTLSVSTLFLFPILAVPSNSGGKVPTKKWLFKPLFVLFFLASYLLLGSQLDKQMILSKSSSPGQQSQHLNHNKEVLQNENQPLELTVNVRPSQFSYGPSKITVKNGQTVSLILNNEDSIEHDIEIKDITFDGNGTENHEMHINKNANFHLHAPAKKQARLTFTPLKKGTYEFYCTIPGHKENGMTGLLIVT